MTGIELHKQGVDGDKEAVKQAHQILEKLIKIVPQDNRVGAYYGSVTALLGRDAVDPNERFALAIKGLKILDEAVGRAPDDTEIRVLRAYVCYRLPETFFHRTATAVEDFGYLTARYEQDAEVFAEGFYHQLLFDLGMAQKNLGRQQEAEQTWLKLLGRTDSPKYRQLIRREGVAVTDPDPGKETGEIGAKPHASETRVPPGGLELHARALAGDKAAAREAADFFAGALKESQNEPLIQAYYADCLSMTGRDADDPTEMFASAIKAMKMLDGAVNAEPDNVQIRLLRAGQSLRLPESFFHRTAAAISDLTYLIDRYEQDHTLFATDTYWRLLYDLGTGYHRLGLTAEGDAAWTKLKKSRPSGEFGALLAERHRACVPGANAGGVSVRKGSPREKALRLHDLAVAGSAAAAKEALNLWEKEFAADPRDPEAEAYYGSSLALAGRYATEPRDIFSNTIKGLVHLKKAIGRDSRNPQLRILRAYLTYSLPEPFFHLTERAIKDFRFLKAAYERDQTVFPGEFYHKILYDLGQAYRRIGQEDEAQKTWAKLRKLNPGPLTNHRSTQDRRCGPCRPRL